MTELIKVDEDTISARAREYASSARAANTRRAYACAWREFARWCEGRQSQALPAQPATVADYIAAIAERGQRASTIAVKLAAIRYAHRSAQAQTDPTASPVVRAVWGGIRRSIGTAQRGKAALAVEELRAMVRVAGDDLRGLRDRALVLVGFAGALRRSELVGLDVEDLRLNGVLRVTVRRSKTDQEGAGIVKTIPATGGELCPVDAVRKWLDASGVKSGAVFRPVDRWGRVRATRLATRDVSRIIKRLADAAGLDARSLAGHSLRAGFVTEAALRGVPEWAIAEVTGHKSLNVLRRYIRQAGRAQADAVRAVLGAPEAARFDAAMNSAGA